MVHNHLNVVLCGRKSIISILETVLKVADCTRDIDWDGVDGNTVLDGPPAYAGVTRYKPE